MCSLPCSAFSVPQGKGTCPPQLLTCTMLATRVTRVPRAACPLMVGTMWRQMLAMPLSESRKGQIWPPLSPEMELAWPWGPWGATRPRKEGVLSFLGRRRSWSSHSFCNNFSTAPGGTALGIGISSISAQAAMGHFVALHTFSSVPPNALWSCKGQST